MNFALDEDHRVLKDSAQVFLDEQISLKALLVPGGSILTRRDFLLTSALADGTHKLGGDDAYTCGLLHYIGKTLLDRLGGTDYKHVEDMVVFGIKDYKAEEAIYGCNHMEVAAEAAKKWGLDEGLICGLNYTQACNDSEPYRFHRACTALATNIATLAVTGSSLPPEEMAHCLPLWAMESMGITEEKAGAIIEGGSAAIATWKMQI